MAVPHSKRALGSAPHGRLSREYCASAQCRRGLASASAPRDPPGISSIANGRMIGLYHVCCEILKSMKNFSVSQFLSMIDGVQYECSNSADLIDFT